MTQQYQNKAFLVPNIGTFIVARNYTIKHIRWHLFQLEYDNNIFKFQVKNTQIDIFCPKFKDCHICIKTRITEKIIKGYLGKNQIFIITLSNINTRK